MGNPCLIYPNKVSFYHDDEVKVHVLECLALQEGLPGASTLTISQHGKKWGQIGVPGTVSTYLSRFTRLPTDTSQPGYLQKARNES